MRSFYLLAFILLAMIGSDARAQQDAQFSQYMFNSLVINPAYAGYKEQLNLNVFYRDQWSGMPGAPTTQSIVFDGAFFQNKKVGLGLAVTNDKAGLQNQSSAYANYAYRLPVGENNARLAFGLALGLSQFVLNGDRAVVEDPSDPNFAGRQSYFTPDAKAGLYYSDKKLYAGISAVNLLSKAINYRQVSGNTVAQQSQHLFLTAGYLFDLKDSIKFKPSLLLREDLKGPTSLDINSFVLIRDKIWVGASYRAGVNLWKKADAVKAFRQNSLVGVVEVFALENLRIGYSYDYAISSLSDYNNGTHELSVGWIIKPPVKEKVRITSPRYF